MAYLLFSICVAYICLWGLGFAFSLRSKGPRQPLIPLVGLAGFVALGLYAFQAIQETKANPPLLTVESFSSLKKGMSVDDVSGILGEPLSDDLDIRVGMSCNGLDDDGDGEIDNGASENGDGTYDCQESGVVLHTALSDLLGSDRHRDKMQARIMLRVDGDAGPMGDRLAQYNEKYESTKTAWNEETADFVADRKEAFETIAQGYREEAEIQQKNAEDADDDASKARAEVQAKGYLDRAKTFETQASYPYEDMHYAMITADGDGELMFGGLGCRMRQPDCPESFVRRLEANRDLPEGEECTAPTLIAGTDASDPEYSYEGLKHLKTEGKKVPKYNDCPLVDLHKKLGESGKFSTIDVDGNVRTAKEAAFSYKQTLNRKVVRHRVVEEAGSQGMYFNIQKVYKKLAKDFTPKISFPPEPPALGLAKWATTECHQQDVDQQRIFQTEELEAITGPREDVDKKESELVISEGVLGLQVSVVENGRELILMEGHVCEEGEDAGRFESAPEWAAKQPGATSERVNEEILGYQECLEILENGLPKDQRSEDKEANQAQCCEAVGGELDEEGKTCTSNEYYPEAVALMEDMTIDVVYRGCESALKTALVDDLKRGKSDKSTVKDILRDMKMDDIYDVCGPDDADCKAPVKKTWNLKTDSHDQLMKLMVEREDKEGYWTLQRKRPVFDDLGKETGEFKIYELKTDDVMTEINNVCKSYVAFHRENQKEIWEANYGPKRPAWQGAMICDDDENYADMVADHVKRAERYLPSKKSLTPKSDGDDDQIDAPSVEQTTTCVWWYSDGMRANDIRETLVAGIQDGQYSSGTYAAENNSKSKKIQLKHNAEKNFGKEGNAAYAQLVSGANDASMVTFKPSGKPENFTGGKPAATLKIWEQKGVIMDGDFSGVDRYLVAGFIDGELAMWREAGIFGDEEKLKVGSVSPSRADVGAVVELTVEGNSLESVSKMTVGGLPVTDLNVGSDGQTITAKSPAGLKEGLYNIEVEGTGMNTSTLINGMRVGPEVESNAPDQTSGGCASVPSMSPLGGLSLAGLLGLMIGLRRRADA